MVGGTLIATYDELLVGKISCVPIEEIYNLNIDSNSGWNFLSIKDGGTNPLPCIKVTKREKYESLITLVFANGTRLIGASDEYIGLRNGEFRRLDSIFAGIIMWRYNHNINLQIPNILRSKRNWEDEDNSDVMVTSVIKSDYDPNIDVYDVTMGDDVQNYAIILDAGSDDKQFFQSGVFVRK